MKFSRRKYNLKKEILYFSLPEQTELTNTVSFCFTLVKCGGPCQLSSFLFIQLFVIFKKYIISEFLLSISTLSTVNIKILTRLCKDWFHGSMFIYFMQTQVHLVI